MHVVVVEEILLRVAVAEAVAQVCAMLLRVRAMSICLTVFFSFNICKTHNFTTAWAVNRQSHGTGTPAGVEVAADAVCSKASAHLL